MKTVRQPNLRYRRFLRFGLRFFLVVIFLVALWIGWHVRRAENQRQAVKQIRAIGGWVHYDFEYQGGRPDSKKPNAGFLPNGNSSIPNWLLQRLGHDFFHQVVELNLISDINHAKPGQPSPVVEYFETGWVSCLDSFPALRRLMVKGAQVDDAVLDAIGDLRMIEELHILGSNSTFFTGRDQIKYDASVSNLGIASLSHAKSLKSLSISFCKLDDESLEYLSKLSNLESLTLQGCEFTDTGVQHLESHRKLERIWLDEASGVTDMSINVLGSIKTLKNLTIQHTLVTNNGVRKFNTLNPNCRFTNYPINKETAR